MKKLLFTTFCFLAFASLSSAQISFGPKLGVGISKFRDVKMPKNQISLNYSYIVVPQIGVMLNAQFGEHFSLRPELLYTQKGTVGKTEVFGPEYQTSIRISYIELPINFVGSIKAGPGNIELFVAPSFAYIVGGKYHSKISGLGNDQTYDDKVVGGKKPADYNDPGNGNTKIYFNPFNVSLNFGAGYKFDNGLLIQAAYNLGLSNLNAHSEDSVEEDKRNDTVVKINSVTLGVAYLFGGKK